MLNSRDIDRLRPDVAANCRAWLELCRAAGLLVLVTGTVRDEEYQQYCFENGTAATPVPSFHGEQAGLAFDFCQNMCCLDRLRLRLRYESIRYSDYLCRRYCRTGDPDHCHAGHYQVR